MIDLLRRILRSDGESQKREELAGLVYESLLAECFTQRELLELSVETLLRERHHLG